MQWPGGGVGVEVVVVVMMVVVVVTMVVVVVTMVVVMVVDGQNYRTWYYRERILPLFLL